MPMETTATPLEWGRKLECEAWKPERERRGRDRETQTERDKERDSSTLGVQVAGSLAPNLGHPGSCPAASRVWELGAPIECYLSRPVTHRMNPCSGRLRLGLEWPAALRGPHPQTHSSAQPGLGLLSQNKLPPCSRSVFQSWLNFEPWEGARTGHALTL